jgi:hypothetical protein
MAWVSMGCVSCGVPSVMQLRAGCGICERVRDGEIGCPIVIAVIIAFDT